MWGIHLSELLACSLIVFGVHHASADPTKSVYKNPIIQDECPITVKVGETFGEAHVTLQKTLEFLLKPNLPQMSIRLMGGDSLYKASVDGTMIELFGCDVFETSCRLLNQGGTKSSDLLMVAQWNRVLVKYINGEVTIDVNMKSSVMGNNMMTMSKTANKGKGGDGGGYVTFVVPPANPSYTALLKISCDEHGTSPTILVAPPAQTTPTPTPTSPMATKPFPSCPVYRVEADHPTNDQPVPEILTFAVYPTHSALQIHFISHQVYIKVQLNGHSATLHKCNMMGQNCFSADSEVTEYDILHTDQWNNITVHLPLKKLFLKVNNKLLLLNYLGDDAHKGLKAIIMAPEDTVGDDGEHFVAMINVQCVGQEQQRTTDPGTGANPTPTPIARSLPTKDSIVESTTPGASSGVSKDVGIVVGVLVGVLLIIAIAIIISAYMKRRKATLNEHSPLQNQHQQQE